MKAIFLDVDGVLIHQNYKNKETENIDEEKIKLLKKIIDETSAKIILTSNWRRPYTENGKEYKQPEYYILSSLLKKYDIYIYDETPIIKATPK
ncbi:MAG: HAD domain-containing protein [Bacilli bacterium]